MEGTDPDVLDGNYKLRTDAIEKCALAAMMKGYVVFAVQDGGLCLVSRFSSANPAFNKYGISQDCKGDGKGGSGANHVYLMGGIQGKDDVRFRLNFNGVLQENVPFEAREKLNNRIGC